MPTSNRDLPVNDPNQPPEKDSRFSILGTAKISFFIGYAAIAILAIVVVVNQLVKDDDPGSGVSHTPTDQAAALQDEGEILPSEDDPDNVTSVARADLTEVFENQSQESPDVNDGVAPDLELPEEPELPAWQRYAVRSKATGRPRIAIVIDDVGMSARRTRELVSLEGPLTLSFLPYATGLRAQADHAREAGHELMVHLPMEPKGTSMNPGPKALMTGLSQPELQDLIDWNLDRFEGYVGVNNHMGSLFTEKRPQMMQVLDSLKSRGLLYLDSRTSSQTVGTGLAQEMGIPNAVRDVFLDNVREFDVILTQFDKVEAKAREQGFAIAIGHPYPVTLEALESWLLSVPRRGLDIVPLSALVSDRPTKLAASR